MVLQLTIFIIGLVILLPSTSLLIKLSRRLANKLRISPLIAGITIVALGTSLPELAVSTTAAMRNDYGLALGNIIGSNISNILLVLPVGIIVGKLRIGTTKTQRSIIILTVISFLYLLLHITKLGSTLSAIVLLAIGSTVTLFEYKWGVSGNTHEDRKRINKLSTIQSDFKITHFTTLLISLVGIIFGGLFIVSATENLSALSGYSTTILGLSLTALATSLPELLTTIFSQGENEEKLTLGNILGSNIYNLTIVGGISAFFLHPIRLPITNWVWFVFSTLLILMVVKVFKGYSVPRYIGIVLLILLGLYLFTLAIAR